MPITSNYFQDKVKLEPTQHRYFDKDGLEYNSMSSVIKHFQKPFEREKMSFMSAKKKLREAGVENPSMGQLKKKQNELKNLWDNQRDEAADIGTKIHDAIEHCIKTGEITIPELEKQLKLIVGYLLVGGYLNFSEVCLFSEKYRLAGTADNPWLRGPRSKILNIRDFKTNQRKGIEYSSKYNNWLYQPVEHLEDCNYNTYSIQLSGYGVMAEEQGYKIGTLSILFIDVVKIFLPEAKLADFLTEIPVSYMRMEAAAMFEKYRYDHPLIDSTLSYQPDEFMQAKPETISKITKAFGMHLPSDPGILKQRMLEI